MEEIWKDIEGYEGLYQVSNLGRVKSLERIIKMVSKGTECYKRIQESVLKQCKSRSGYYLVVLSKNGGQKNLSVHRLVAKAFIPNPNNYPQVNHKDECKTNNIVWVNEDGTIDQEKSNLEWCTNSYNVNYGTRTIRCGNTLINRNDLSKVVYQFNLYGELLNKWESLSEAGRNGYCVQGISRCINGKMKTYKNSIWSFDNKISDYSEFISKNRRKKVIAKDKDGNKVYEFNSTREAEKLGYNHASINKCCRGEYKYHKGLYWSYDRN